MESRFANLNIALGLWLALAPWLLAYDVALSRYNGVVVGVLVMVSAFAAMLWPPARWANTGLGAWLIASPFVLGYGIWDPSMGLAVSARWAAVNHVVVGAMVLSVSLIPSIQRWQPRAPSARGA